jgi:hypothetical protein
MTEPQITFSNDPKYVLWGENAFLVSMDYELYRKTVVSICYVIVIYFELQLIQYYWLQTIGYRTCQ